MKNSAIDHKKFELTKAAPGQRVKAAVATPAAAPTRTAGVRAGESAPASKPVSKP
jgi:hypothetical protein